MPLQFGRFLAISSTHLPGHTCPDSRSRQLQHRRTSRTLGPKYIFLASQSEHEEELVYETGSSRADCAIPFVGHFRALRTSTNDESNHRSRIRLLSRVNRRLPSAILSDAVVCTVCAPASTITCSPRAPTFSFTSRVVARPTLTTMSWTLTDLNPFGESPMLSEPTASAGKV